MSELHEKGEHIYKTRILPQLPVDNLKGQIIAIDIKSTDYFIEDTVLKAVMLGRKRYPQRKFLIVTDFGDTINNGDFL